MTPVVAGSAGISGICGIEEKLSLAGFVAAGALADAVAGAGLSVVADGTGVVGGATDGAPDGHAGAVFSVVSDAPFVAAIGGTPSGAWFQALVAAACGCTGPSLIFT